MLKKVTHKQQVDRMNTLERRVLFPEELRIVASFYLPGGYRKGREVIKWLETNTSGKFYIGQGFVSFNDEADVLMFRLGPHYDVNRISKMDDQAPAWAKM